MFRCFVPGFMHDMATNLVGFGEDGLHDRDEVGFVGKVCDIEQSLELLQTNGDGCTGHESNNGCVGQKCDDEPQPATQASQGLNKFKIRGELCYHRSEV
jgi:hypothetical protein